jgi:hypothetical protein
MPRLVCQRWQGDVQYLMKVGMLDIILNMQTSHALILLRAAMTRIGRGSWCSHSVKTLEEQCTSLSNKPHMTCRMQIFVMKKSLDIKALYLHPVHSAHAVSNIACVSGHVWAERRASHAADCGKDGLRLNDASRGRECEPCCSTPHVYLRMKKDAFTCQQRIFSMGCMLHACERWQHITNKYLLWWSLVHTYIHKLISASLERTRPVT